MGSAAASQLDVAGPRVTEDKVAGECGLPGGHFAGASPKTLGKTPGPLSGPGQYTWCTPAPDGTGQVSWRVRAQFRGHLVVRHVWRDGKALDEFGHRWAAEKILWPGLSAKSKEEIDALGSPLADMQEYWSAVANRLRDAAKWTATALGAALAAVIGTSPLAAMRVQRPHSAAIILAAAGLLLLGITMFLVLQVMRPKSVSYGDVESARSRRWMPQRSLYKLKQVIDVHQDLYLPCGISGLDSLRQSMVIEEATLMALADAIATAADATATTAFCEAKAARAERLLQLRVAAARIATIGEYYKLRRRSSWATYCGMPCGLLATAAIVAAFAWPVG